MRVKDAVGRFGEQVATDHLRAAGFTILERNWRCPAGEIDVVALDSSELVVVEVKTRSSPFFGSPMEAVNHAKIARLRRLAAMWMAQEHADSRPSWTTVRFDVIAVLRIPGCGSSGRVEVSHVRGAF